MDDGEGMFGGTYASEWHVMYVPLVHPSSYLIVGRPGGWSLRKDKKTRGSVRVVAALNPTRFQIRLIVALEQNRKNRGREKGIEVLQIRSMARCPATS
jgi:hypothetical protein